MATFKRYKESDKWQAIIRKKGYPVLYKTFKLKDDAVKWATVIEASMIQNVFVDNKEASSTTLSDALDRYKDYAKEHNKGFEMEFNRIERWKAGKLGQRALSSLRSKDFDEYRDMRRADGISDATIRNDLAVISALFKHFDYGMNSPATKTFKTLATSEERDRRLTKIEEEYLLEQLDNTQCSNPKRANKWIPIIARFSIETSARRSELVGFDKTKNSPSYPGLLWENVDFENCVCKFIDTKNCTDRFAPLSPNAIEQLLIAKKLNPADTGPVFLTTSSAIKQAWARAKTRAQKKYKADGGEDTGFLIDYRWHDNRHEAASRWSNEFDIKTLKIVTGHKDIRSLMRYVNPDKNDVAKVAKLMSKKGS